MTVILIQRDLNFDTDRESALFRRAGEFAHQGRTIHAILQREVRVHPAFLPLRNSNAGIRFHRIDAAESLDAETRVAWSFAMQAVQRIISIHTSRTQGPVLDAEFFARSDDDLLASRLAASLLRRRVGSARVVDLRTAPRPLEFAAAVTAVGAEVGDAWKKLSA